MGLGLWGMNESIRQRLLGPVSAYADEVACALGSGPPRRRSRLWRDLEACELLLGVLLLNPALVPQTDAEPLREAAPQTALAENLDPRQGLAPLGGMARRS